MPWLSRYGGAVSGAAASGAADATRPAAAAAGLLAGEDRRAAPRSVSHSASGASPPRCAAPRRSPGGRCDGIVGVGGDVVDAVPRAPARARSAAPRRRSCPPSEPAVIDVSTPSRSECSSISRFAVEGRAALGVGEHHAMARRAADRSTISSRPVATGAKGGSISSHGPPPSPRRANCSPVRCSANVASSRSRRPARTSTLRCPRAQARPFELPHEPGDRRGVVGVARAHVGRGHERAASRRAAAARASASEPSIVAGPSSMPGSTWQCRSIIVVNVMRRGRRTSRWCRVA